MLANEIWPNTKKALIESTQVNFKTHQVNIALLFNLVNGFSYCFNSVNTVFPQVQLNSLFFPIHKNIFIQLLFLDN